jgi:hypothetical protein
MKKGSMGMNGLRPSVIIGEGKTRWTTGRDAFLRLPPGGDSCCSPLALAQELSEVDGETWAWRRARRSLPPFTTTQQPQRQEKDARRMKLNNSQANGPTVCLYSYKDECN